MFSVTALVQFSICFPLLVCGKHLAMLCLKCHLLNIKFLFIKQLYKTNITLAIMLL